MIAGAGSWNCGAASAAATGTSVAVTVEVDDRCVRVKGSKDLIEKAVIASQNGPAGCSQMSTTWRARRDSNS
jgi:hypothetical protein